MCAVWAQSGLDPFRIVARPHFAPVRLDALGLTIAVRDYNACELLVPLAFSATGHRDQGLFLVASISRAWGVSPTEDGKSVWALLPVPER